MSSSVDLDPKFALACLGALVGVVGWRILEARKSRLPLPPGPKGLPLVGNIREIPTEYEWLTYRRYAEQYGDMVYLQALGKKLLVLDSMEAVTELMERRGNRYSSRPVFEMIKLAGFMVAFVNKPYGSEWRTHRRMLHGSVHQGVANQYHPMLQWSTHLYLRQLLDRPTEFFDLTHELTGRFIMRMVYDIKISGKDDRHVAQIDKLMHYATQITLPGRFLVEFLPILRYIPTWMPGAGFKRTALSYRPLVDQMLDEPMDITRAAMAKATNRPCLVSNLLEQGSPTDEAYVKIVKDLAFHTYTAGADTTSATTTFFVLAMLRYPAIQARAQAELDAVLESCRLPEFSDMPHLPYIQAVVLETLRWIPTIPLGFPHQLTEDDEYRGYFIPKGTVVMHNTWSILHNAEIYPDPEEFKPERFLKEKDGVLEIDPDVLDPRDIAFGAGRRICPGRWIALESLFLIMSSMLSAFTIEPAVDADGNPIDAPVHVAPGFLSQITPFKYAMKPRSARWEELVREAAAAADKY